MPKLPWTPKAAIELMEEARTARAAAQAERAIIEARQTKITKWATDREEVLKPRLRMPWDFGRE